MSELLQPSAEQPEQRFNSWLVLGPDPDGNPRKRQVLCTECNRPYVRYFKTIKDGTSKKCIRCTGSNWYISEKGRPPVIGVDVPAKKCGVCNREKQVVLNASVATGWIYQCSHCVNKRQTARYHQPRTRAMMDAHALSAKFKRYGMTTEQAKAMWLEQDCKCAICSKPLVDPTSLEEGSKGTHIDHCHENGHVRGMLCSNCNRGIGYFNDDPARIREAIQYLNGANLALVRSVVA